MTGRIEIQETNIEYTYKISARARHLRVAVHAGGLIVVTVPRVFDKQAAENFLRQKSAWLLAAFNRQKLVPVFDKHKQQARYIQAKAQALRLAQERIEYFNSIYNFRINKISIKNHKTLWGSCSKKGNLNFNFRIAFLPADQRDYIIVHELCHLAEFNHSPKFWSLVSRTIPNHKALRRILKTSGLNFS